jgi:tRNA G18 (ribose-2'-O)-methylase SpoU
MMVSTHHFPTTKLALRYVKETYPGMTVLAMETTDRSKIYSRVNYGETRTAGVAIIMGNEVTGVDSELLQQDHVVDEIIELPTFGRKNSLNVAACAPVVIYEILRQWNAAR